MSISKEPQRPKYKRKKKKVSFRSKDIEDWTLEDWKEWLWELFSKYIRLRDCIKTTGTTKRGRCVTCSKIYPINKGFQAGHFIPGRADAILFDPDCVHGQCYRCNVVLGGDWPAYYRWMQANYGQEKIEQLIDQRNEKVELTVEWIQEAYEYYTKQIEELHASTISN